MKSKWQIRAEKAESERDTWMKSSEVTEKLLREARTELSREMAARPVVTETVEKEVLPWWVPVVLILCVWFEVLLFITFWFVFKNLQQPIEKPYAVYLHYPTDKERNDAIEVIRLGVKLTECQSDYKRMWKQGCRP